MGKVWDSRLSDAKRELPVILAILAIAALLNLLVAGQRLALTIYNLPTLFAAYYFGRRRAVLTALASILVVWWTELVHPVVLGGGFKIGLDGLLNYSDLTIWGGFLLISAYATGTLHERQEQRLRELRETYYGVLQILNYFISNDKYPQHHSYRVSTYATQIAQCLGLPKERVEDVRAAALLHDIGKLEISRGILYKAARLNEEELREMKLHVKKGVELLSPVGGSLRRVLPIILAHHDKFDGTGYRSTRGHEIPLEARIISVADVYDSLVSDRPYRKGMSPFEARDIIVKGAGADFDPEVVAAFETAFRSQQMEVPEIVVA